MKGGLHMFHYVYYGSEESGLAQEKVNELEKLGFMLDIRLSPYGMYGMPANDPKALAAVVIAQTGNNKARVTCHCCCGK